MTIISPGDAALMALFIDVYCAPLLATVIVAAMGAVIKTEKVNRITIAILLYMDISPLLEKIWCAQLSPEVKNGNFLLY
jgi:hypothetical protein